MMREARAKRKSHIRTGSERVDQSITQRRCFMDRVTYFAGVCVVSGLLLAVPSLSMAGGQGNQDCLDPGAKGAKITGEGVSTFFDYDSGNSAEIGIAILRLKKGGQIDVFRARIETPTLENEEAWFCDVLAAEPRNVAGDTIQTAFGLGSATLKIHPTNSVSSSNPGFPAYPSGCSVVTTPPAICDLVSISDVNIFFK